MPDNFTLDANQFAKCSPSIRTNIKQCGSVTVCNAYPLESDEQADIFMKSGDFRVMEALLYHEMEIKMCEARVYGLYEFMMANKVSLSHRLETSKRNPGLLEIRPFVLAKQYSPINNEWWKVTDGVLDEGTGYYSINVSSLGNVPADVRSFPVGMRVFITSKSAGGSACHTAWVVVTATLGTDEIALVLSSQNTASNMDADKLGYPTGDEVGLLTRGTPNVSPWEKWCNEGPAYLNWKYVPFWMETVRDSMCYSSLYDQWRKLVLAGNPLYREYFDLDEVQKNRQLAEDWQKRLVRTMFSNKPLDNQTLSAYNSLENILTFNPADVGAPALGVDGGKCVGKRANAVGLYEQMAECDRVFDLQGAQLNIADLAILLYNMMRVREANHHPKPMEFDLFMDSVYAELFNQAMLSYYIAKSQNTARLNINAEGMVPQLAPHSGRVEPKEAKFGFYYTSWRLFWPQGIKINIVTHNFFDDMLSAAASAGIEDVCRVIWILDFTGIYPGIIHSERKVHKTGDLQTLASVLPEFACVMKVPFQEQTLLSLSYTMVVECPAGNAIIENIALTIPDATSAATGVFSGTTTTTTTTTTAPQ